MVLMSETDEPVAFCHECLLKAIHLIEQGEVKGVHSPPPGWDTVEL